MSRMEQINPSPTPKPDEGDIKRLTYNTPTPNESDTEKPFYLPAIIEEQKRDIAPIESKPKNEVAIIEGETPLSETGSKREGKIRIGLIDATSLMESRVRDIADERMTTEKGELKGMSGIFKKIWKHNLAKEYYRQKEMASVRENIRRSGTTFVDRDDADIEKTAHQAAMGAIAERFITDGEEMLHRDSGEKREVLTEKDAKKDHTQQVLKDLVMRYGNEEIADENAFQEEKKKIIESLKGSDAQVTFADNLFNVAKQVRQAIEAGTSADALEKDLEIVTGEARAGVRTEANLSACDRLIEKLHSTRLGSMVNETTLALAVGAAWSAGVFAGTRLTSSKLAALASFGGTAAMGAGVAAIRESTHMKEDRAQHIRDIAQGKSIDPENKERREEMEKSTYEMCGAKDLAKDIQDSLFQPDTEGKLVLKQNIGKADIDATLQLLAQAEARIKLSDTQNIDLLSYSSAEDVEQERLDLDLARAKTKVEIRKLLAENPKMLQQEDGTPLTVEQYLKNSLDTNTQNIEKSLNNETTKRDELFETMRRKHMGKAALKALGTGLLLGTVTQEALAFATEQQGFVEGLVSGNHPNASSETLLQYLAGNKITGGEIPPHDTSLLGHSTEHLSAKAWMEQQPGTTKIERLGWQDNDTAVFDKNELKLQWGGKNGTGIDSDGNYVFSMKHMLADGSRHGGLSSDAMKLAKEGKLEMIISASKETQGQVLKVPINEKGMAVFDAKNEALAKFFSIQNGKAVFMGKYAEVAEVVQPIDDSHVAEQVRILATHVGKGNIDTTIIKDIPTSVPADIPTIIPVIPISGRDPLEKMKKKDTKKTEKSPVTPPQNAKKTTNENLKKNQPEAIVYNNPLQITHDTASNTEIKRNSRQIENSSSLQIENNSSSQEKAKDDQKNTQKEGTSEKTTAQEGNSTKQETNQENIEQRKKINNQARLIADTLRDEIEISQEKTKMLSETGFERFKKLYDEIVEREKYSEDQTRMLIDALIKEGLPMQLHKPENNPSSPEKAKDDQKSTREEGVSEKNTPSKKEEGTNEETIAQEEKNQEDISSFEVDKKNNESDEEYYKRCQQFLVKTFGVKENASYEALLKAMGKWLYDNKVTDISDQSSQIHQVVTAIRVVEETTKKIEQINNQAQSIVKILKAEKWLLENGKMSSEAGNTTLQALFNNEVSKNAYSKTQVRMLSDALEKAGIHKIKIKEEGEKNRWTIHAELSNLTKVKQFEKKSPGRKRSA